MRARLVALAASVALLGAPLLAVQGEPQDPPEGAPPETTRDTAQAPAREAVPLIRALRDTRAKPPPPAEPTVAFLAASGAAGVPHLVDLLVAARLPALELTERVQTLSVPQREMILEALARSAPGIALQDAEARLADADGATEPERAAALYVIACAGDSTKLARAFELALAPEETELTDSLKAAFGCAVERVLRRDPRAFASLPRELERCRPELHGPIATAIGAARNPDACETLTRMLSMRRDLAGAILAQVRMVGRSRDLAVNRELASAVVDHLDPARTELCSTAARTLGELNDSDHFEKLIDLLESPSAPVRDSALWALRRISRLQLPEDPKPWRRWHQVEAAFWANQAPSLLSQLQRGTRATKIKAVNELAKHSLHRDEIALAIADVLLEPDPVLRETACKALAALDSPMALPPLADALDDSEETVRASAHAAIQGIAGTAVPSESESCRRQLGI